MRFQMTPGEIAAQADKARRGWHKGKCPETASQDADEGPESALQHKIMGTGRVSVLAIDPGPTESAFVVWDGCRIGQIAKVKNEVLLAALLRHSFLAHVCVIEQIKSYGMAVSDSIFDTVFWTGRFCQAWGTQGAFERVPRRNIKMHLCGSMRARDSNIRQVLIDRFGPPGTKKNPGLTYGLSGDMWAAFALSVTWYDIHFLEIVNGRV